MVVLKATEYTIGSSVFMATVTPACECTDLTALHNGERVRFVTCKSLPAITSLLPVQISLNGEAYPVYDQFGNLLESDQLKSRRKYEMRFGTNPVHFIMTTPTMQSQATPSYVEV